MKADAIAQLFTSFFVVIVFVGGSFIVCKDASTYVVSPLEKLMEVTKKLAKTVNLLSGGSADSGHEVNCADSENFAVDQMLVQLTSAFGLDKEADTGPQGAQADQDLNIAPGLRDNMNRIRKEEDIRRKNSTLGSNPDNPDMEVEVDKKGAQVMDARGIPRVHTELSSLNRLLEHPDACQGLRRFMAKQLTLENYLFWKEAHDYQQVTRDRAEKICQTFMKDTSANEINISSKMLQTTLTTLGMRDEASGRPIFPVSVFNDAHDEIYKLIYKNSYLEFLRSSVCDEYLAGKEQVAADGGNGKVVRAKTASMKKTECVEDVPRREQKEDDKYDGEKRVKRRNGR